MPSPSREPPAGSTAHHATNLMHTELQAPPSPRTHRALRRLQSAHTLGAKAAAHGAQSSLISQQRRELQRNASPTRLGGGGGGSSNATAAGGGGGGGVSNTTAPAVARPVNRGRANSDAMPPLVHQMNAVTATRRTGVKKPVFSHGHLSLQQIVREGPTDGDFVGALESARWKVVDEGIKSAEDGMVRILLPIITETDECLQLCSRRCEYMSGWCCWMHPSCRQTTTSASSTEEPRPHTPRYETTPFER